MTKQKLLYALAVLVVLGAYFVEATGFAGGNARIAIFAVAAAIAFWGYSSPPIEDYDE